MAIYDVIAGSWPTLAQAMTRCLMAPSHYQNQCSLLISEVLWHSPDISQQVPNLLVCVISMKMILSKLLPYLPGVNELMKINVNPAHKKWSYIWYRLTLHTSLLTHVFI